ncbi:PREDICTED: splicing regulator RBM11 [Nanorana parkeri]|uniref:splicing regulator RBM11 n=1 Tax=Nanorana parkeri TaxID=125878 RepID=UPI0008541C23|nr:PREDICTED: splicing regulator RBM11 [Nanorana parkeri]
MLSRQNEADRTLFVGNLDYNVKEETLYELFLQAGPLSKVTIAKDKEGNCKSFGFVCFQHLESVPYAIELLNGIRLFGRPIKLQYRTGSTHSSESDSVFKGPENGFVSSPLEYGMPVSGGNYDSSHPAPPVDSSFFSQAYVCFQGMMNQFFALQNPAFGWTAPEQQGYEQFFPWNKQTSMYPYSGPQPSCSTVPGSSSWDSEMAQDCRISQSEAGSQNHKRTAENIDSDSSETSLREYKPSKRQRKLRAKKKKNLVYCTK